METLGEMLEEMRVLHERRDRLEMAIADEMMVKRAGHKDQLDSQHRQKRLLDKYMTSSRELLQMYKRDIIRPDHNKSIHKACNEFYDKYNMLLETPDAQLEDEPYDAFRENIDSNTLESLLEPTSLAVVVCTPVETGSNPLAIGSDAPLSVATTLPLTTIEKLVEFTDEEGYGRYLDLNACHDAFLQVVKDQDGKPNYLAYLNKFDKFHRELERERKMTSAYKRYVELMLNYFRDYSRRARPLFDNGEFEIKVEEKFQEQWRSRNIPGWFSAHELQQELPTEPMVDLMTYNSIEHLMELGLDCLKRELQVRNLKCGGTLEDRANRLWLVRGKQPDEIDNLLKVGGNTKRGAGKRRVQIEASYIALIEAKLAGYAEYFTNHRQATIENVQRKQARTADERNESDDDVSDIEDDDESDHDDVVYNPKNLPLGWDGKPIPYWMYKLHGLNLTFTCEICGNAIYKGPKTFQRHFAEQRHAHGMKCLGIPNTAHFADITSIQEAIILWDKLKSERQKDQFQPQADEEFEDSQGNVVNRKTYEDLKRQGLL